MKKTATLVAGLLLVTGTVLATGLSGWDLTGTTVEGDLWLMNSESGALVSEGGDLDITLNASKETEVGKFGVEVSMEKRELDGTDSDSDHEVTLSYSRTQGNFEVGLGAKIISNSGANVTDDAEKSEFRLETKDNSDSYLKWNMSEKASLTYYPWEVADVSWDNETWESFDIDHEGGLAFAMKVNEGTTVTLKYAITAGNNDIAENEYLIKAELDTKLSNGTLKAYVGTETSDNSIMAAGALANMNLSEAMALTAEVNYEDADNYEDAKMGAYAKVAVKLADMSEYKPTAYASFQYLNDAVAENSTSEDFMELEAGLTLAQGNFSVTPKVVLSMQDGGFTKEKDGGSEDSATKVGVNFKYAL